MMSHTWPILLRGGMLSLRGYPPGYALMIISHRLLRYGSPVPARARPGAQHRAGRAGGGGSFTSSRWCSSWRCCAAARSAGALPLRPLLIARYYVLTTASLRGRAVGLAAPRHQRLVGGRGGNPLKFRALMRRMIDILASAAGLLLSCPLLLAAAIAIRLESPGAVDLPPAPRRAWTGSRFEMLKLRTMVDGAEHIGAGLAINENDARITRVGALLRRTSLDELPNLVNVLRGEMSLIGPRPRSPPRSSSTPSASAGASRSSPGSPAGPRSTAGPPCPGRSGSSSTSTTSNTARSP